MHLDGYLIHSETDSVRGIIITLHGIGAYKERFPEFSNRMAREGFQTVLFDMRGHGQSGGDYCTYGYYERHDVSAIIDKLTEGGDSLPIGVYGQSMGGAVAYQVLAADRRLDFGIVESIFDDLRNVIHEYGKRWAGYNCNALCDFALWRAEAVADFEADSVSPVKSAARISVPVFVAHGTDDKNIPIDFGKRNFEALASKNKTFFEVRGAGHINLSSTGGLEYELALSDFLDNAILISEGE